MFVSDKDKGSMYPVEGSKLLWDATTEFLSVGLDGQHATVGDMLLYLKEIRKLLIGVSVFVFYEDLMDMIQILWTRMIENLLHGYVISLIKRM